MSEIHRAGVEVVLADGLEWFAWQPKRARVILAQHLTIEQRRAALALALAHRALGHWGNTLAQDVEARNLAASWLIPSRLCPPLLRSADAYHEMLAQACSVTVQAVRVKYGLACDSLSNIEIHRGQGCFCVTSLCRAA